MRLSITSSLVTLSLLTLAACDSGNAENDAKKQLTSPVVEANSDGADEMASQDPGPGKVAGAELPDAEGRPLMQAQVVLERLGFGPGIVDGKLGMSFANAIKGFQESRNLDVNGELDEATRQALARWDNIPATRLVTIPQPWGDIEFAQVPEGASQQAEMKRLGYENMSEALAERFHTTPDVLAQLNPGGQPARSGSRPATSGSTPTSSPGPGYSPGQKIRVPNVGADRVVASQVDDKDWLNTMRSLGVGTDQPSVAKIAVDESEGWLKAYDKDDQLVGIFTVTTGSQNDPLPLGNWEVTGIAYNPPFAFDPKLFWDVPSSQDKQQLPPGPNGPVGVVWIDLSKEHYGIHGTPAPEAIGRTQSHGCIRLTNWDAARLAQMVSGDTKVVFKK